MRAFLDSPADLDKRVERLLRHFEHAAYLFLTERRAGLPTASDLVLILLRDAMRTHQAMPDMEIARLSKVRTLMPPSRFSDADAYQLELSRLLAGMSAFDATRVRVSVSADDVERMVDVLDLLRFVHGFEAERDCRLVLAAASGMTLEQCGRIWERDRVWSHMREVRRLIRQAEQRVAGQILIGIERTFGLKRTGRGFRKASVVEIERRRPRAS